MNEQRPPNAIEWTRIRNPDGTYRRGFTWNPVSGCLHDCEWDIAGERAVCYALTIANESRRAYPAGFAHYYWHPQKLSEPGRVSEPAGIFPDSMSDLFGAWVDPVHLNAVLAVMRDTPQHIYQCLTKNGPGYQRALSELGTLPGNLWPGISSPPDHMLGNDLNDTQKERYLRRALRVFSDLHRYNPAAVTWMSFEPLSRDCSKIIADTYPGVLRWAVIGAASKGRRYYPPEEKHVRDLLAVLDDQHVPVFFKGNMRSLEWAAQNWRADFPVLT